MRCVKIFLLITSVIATMSIVSCKKANPTVNYNTVGQQTAIGAVYSDAPFLEVYNQAVNSSSNQWAPVASITGSCAAIVISGYAFPKTLTVNYGPGCYDSTTGITRKGMITATFTEAFNAASAIITLSSSNYAQSIPNTQSFYSYSGTKIITNTTPTATQFGPNYPIFTVTDNNVSIKDPHGDTINWNDSLTEVWYQGSGNIPNIVSSDVFSITGWAQGTTSDLTYFRLDIAGAWPWIKPFTCLYPQSGLVTYTVEGSKLSTENFGLNGGVCSGGAADTLHYNGTVSGSTPFSTIFNFY